MSLVVRYFSTTSAGAADGTTWADRAALFSAGNWSSVITGFAFNGSDALECRVGPGNYTCSQALASGLFANPPTLANSLFFHGCDASGNKLNPPNGAWKSNQPAFDDSTLPLIPTTTNIATVNLANTFLRLLKITASGRNGVVIPIAAKISWCVVINSTANASANCVGGVSLPVYNSVLSCTGSIYSSVWSDSSLIGANVRCIGNAGASGNRDGVVFSGTNAAVALYGITSINNGGRGFAYTGSNTGVNVRLSHCTIANNGGDGIVFPNTAAQTARQFIEGCSITGNTGIGINPGGANTIIVLANTRLRDNGGGNLGTWGNTPQDSSVYTIDSDDPTEYVDVSVTGDFRIKTSAATWGGGYGVSDQAVGGVPEVGVGTGRLVRN